MAASTPKQPGERLEDGWTHVGKGKSGARTQPVRLTHDSNTNPPARDMTLQRIQTDFDIKLKLWRASTCRKRVLQILDKQQPDEGWLLTSAICLATGSFSRENWQSRQRSLMQLAAFLDLVEHLQNGQDSPIHCVAQDPCYTVLDKAFFASKDVTMLEYEDGQAASGLGPATGLLSSSSFVFEPFLDSSLQSMADLLSVEMPLYIGALLPAWSQGSERSVAALTTVLRQKSDDLTVEAVRKLVDQAVTYAGQRRCYRFPASEEDPNVFEGLMIYWKEFHDEEEE